MEIRDLQRGHSGEICKAMVKSREVEEEANKMCYQLESSLIQVPQGALEQEGQPRLPTPTLHRRVRILCPHMSQPLAVGYFAGKERPLLWARGRSGEEEKAYTVGSHYSHTMKSEGSNLEKGILAEDQAIPAVIPGVFTQGINIPAHIHKIFRGQRDTDSQF